MLGLFKLKCVGSQMIALCLKSYYVDKQDREKKKFSTKGMSKRQNNITWQRFKAALNGSTDRAENRGFRRVNRQMATYKQQKQTDRQTDSLYFSTMVIKAMQLMESCINTKPKNKIYA